MNARSRTWAALQPSSAAEPIGRAIDLVVATTIIVAIVSVVLESMPSLAAYKGMFAAVEALTLAVFVPEYLLRLWSCTADSKYGRRWGRFRWALSPSAIIDFLAIVPAVVSAGTIDLRVLRGLRLLRLFRLGRYSRGITVFARVLRESREQLLIAMSIIVVVLLIASSLLHIVERDAQPEAFGSIPAAMWWGVATLTTVGYGDVAPVTDLGRVLAGGIAILGVGTFALPAGIIAGSFERVLGQREAAHRCPHCGLDLRGDVAQDARAEDTREARAPVIASRP